MAVETFSSNKRDLRYSVDEHGRRYRRTQQEMDVIELGEEFGGILDQSTLSDDDKQQLRSISARYVMATTPLPEEDSFVETRHAILDYLTSDLPELVDQSTSGLCRVSNELGPTQVAVDGRRLSTHELELIYTVIEPSREVLDGVTDETLLWHVDTIDTRVTKAAAEDDDVQDPAEYDIDYFEADELPSIEERHTLRDELQPISDRLRLIGGTVVSIVGRRRASDESTAHQHKIAS